MLVKCYIRNYQFVKSKHPLLKLNDYSWFFFLNYGAQFSQVMYSKKPSYIVLYAYTINYTYPYLSFKKVEWIIHSIYGVKKFHSLSSEFHSILTLGEWKFSNQRVESRPVHSIYSLQKKITDVTIRGVKIEWNFPLFFIEILWLIFTDGIHRKNSSVWIADKRRMYF